MPSTKLHPFASKKKQINPKKKSKHIDDSAEDEDKTDEAQERRDLHAMELEEANEHSGFVSHEENHDRSSSRSAFLDQARNEEDQEHIADMEYIARLNKSCSHIHVPESTAWSDSVPSSMMADQPAFLAPLPRRLPSVFDESDSLNPEIIPNSIKIGYSDVVRRYCQTLSATFPTVARLQTMVCSRPVWLWNQEIAEDVLRVHIIIVPSALSGCIWLAQFNDCLRDVTRAATMICCGFQTKNVCSLSDSSFCRMMDLPNEAVDCYAKCSAHEKKECLTYLMDVQCPKLRDLSRIGTILLCSGGAFEDVGAIIEFIDDILQKARDDGSPMGGAKLIIGCTSNIEIAPVAVQKGNNTCSVRIIASHINPDVQKDVDTEQTLLNTMHNCLLNLVDKGVTTLRCSHPNGECPLVWRHLYFQEIIGHVATLNPTISARSAIEYMKDGNKAALLLLYRECGQWLNLLPVVVQTQRQADAWNAHFTRKLQAAQRKTYGNIMHKNNLNDWGEVMSQHVVEPPELQILKKKHPTLNNLVWEKNSFFVSMRVMLLVTIDVQNQAGCLGTILGFKDDLPVVMMDIAQEAIVVNLVQYRFPLDKNCELVCRSAVPLVAAFALPVYILHYLQIGEMILHNMTPKALQESGILPALRSVSNVWFTDEKLPSSLEAEGYSSQDDSDLSSESDME